MNFKAPDFPDSPPLQRAARAFLFPGQGSQKVGMGEELAREFACAREVLEEVDDALGFALSRIIREGGEETLTRTENTQPALMAVSMAVARVLRRESGMEASEQAVLVAGHSLGECSALAAVGAFSLGDAARLLRLRGAAMQRAVPVGEGAMAAVLGLPVEQVAAVAAEAAEREVCVVANDNAPGQSVLSGHAGAVARASSLAKEKGARRVIPLSVSAPFHCPLMTPAAEEVRAALGAVPIRPPRLPVASNARVEPMRDAAEIPDLLATQITSMVRWREIMAYLEAQGVSEVVELGAGTVLSGLARRCAPQMRALSLETPTDIREYLETTNNG